MNHEKPLPPDIQIDAYVREHHDLLQQAIDDDIAQSVYTLDRFKTAAFIAHEIHKTNKFEATVSIYRGIEMAMRIAEQVYGRSPSAQDVQDHLRRHVEAEDQQSFDSYYDETAAFLGNNRDIWKFIKEYSELLDEGNGFDHHVELAAAALLMLAEHQPPFDEDEDVVTIE